MAARFLSVLMISFFKCRSMNYTDFASEETRIEIRSCQVEDSIDSNERINEFRSVSLKILLTWLLIVIGCEIIKSRPSLLLHLGLSSSSEKTVHKVAACLSVRENSARLLDEDQRDNFKFIYGYRMIFMLGSTVIHVFMMPIFWSPLAMVNMLTPDAQTTCLRYQLLVASRAVASNSSAGMPVASVRHGVSISDKVS